MIQGGIGTFTTTASLPTPEPSASTPPPTAMASISPPSAVTVQHIANHRTSSDILDVPSLFSPTPVPDNMLPTDSHLSMLGPAVPFASYPRSISSPGLGAAAEDEGNPKAGLRKNKDTLDSTLTIREYIMAVPDLLTQSPSPPSVTGVAIALHSLDAERTVGCPPSPHHLYNQCDVVLRIPL